MEGFIKSEYGIISFSRFGKGTNVWLCFHGFGQTGKSFQALGNVLNEDCTFYCLDLFYHGKTSWKKGEDQPITKAEFAGLMKLFFEQNFIAEFSLLSYSLGTMPALTCLEYYFHKIHKVIMLAPQGVMQNNWYSLATRNMLSRFLFKFSMTNIWLFSTITALIKKKYEVQINLQKNRGKRIYQFWIVLRELKSDPRIIQKLLNENEIPVWLFAGKDDELISFPVIKPFFDALQKKEIRVLDGGHEDFINTFVSFMQEQDLTIIFKNER